ncbi:hypothetical protein SAMN06296020_101186 [Anoxynatronum buryatiense]|uniref:Uncharacterized protein n=1 Tax=Anoxynatronum buryatiense TaxID=489973 RepID=A0AA46AHH0_9CLOT|nr:hypothetical protein SAMN06296020_101186 [Anoxynatronum buryatiense]
MEAEREAGVNPARSRHCEGEPAAQVTGELLPGRRSAGNEPKSGNLLMK